MLFARGPPGFFVNTPSLGSLALRPSCQVQADTEPPRTGREARPGTIQPLLIIAATAHGPPRRSRALPLCGWGLILYWSVCSLWWEVAYADPPDRGNLLQIPPEVPKMLCFFQRLCSCDAEPLSFFFCGWLLLLAQSHHQSQRAKIQQEP